MDKKKYEALGGGDIHQLNNNRLFNLQLFGNTLNYTKVNNPYNLSLDKLTYTKGDIEKTAYSLASYYKKIPDYGSITSLPEENAEYIKEALPNVTNCSSMLGSCKALTFIDTTGWDTSKVTSMRYMFSNCNALTTLDVSSWDTSKVTTMFGTFHNCYVLTSLDVSNWNTSNVTDMTEMFWGCNKLATLDTSKWDTSKVTNMYSMFADCNELTTLDISSWDTSNVTDMSYMFDFCSALTTIKGAIDMKSCTIYGDMFAECPELTGVKIKNPPSGITAASGIGGLKAGKYEIVS